MACAASCSFSAGPSSEKYDVFISFRGEDTRRNFVSHLYAALCRKQIKTCKDDKTLEKGDEVWPALVCAINDSSLCIVVFSKDYASSTWCLRELTQVLECKRQGQIIPVFYEIDPSHIRKQTGSYKEAFEKHEKDSKLHEETVKKWKASLEIAANFSGWDSQSKDYRDESKLIDKIVKEVSRKLSYKYPPHELRGLIGIEKNIAYVESLLPEVQTIGIWGMGGIGKTTIAKAVFYRLSLQYESCCFLANVREESEKHGLNHLRSFLLSELLDEEDIHKVETSFAMSRLRRKKVLIVLDDVNDSEQLEHLVGDYDCLRPDSKVIVTTRDRQVLISRGVEKIYEVSKLNFVESRVLLSMNAFGQNHPKIGFEELTRRVVVYAGGIPLALKVLGSTLRSKRREVWESTLRRLEKFPDVKIQNVLRLSYDYLGHLEKEIFLDIACFLKGEHGEYVTRFLDACDFYAASRIEILEDRALITTSFGIIQLHDLIQDMGREIVHEESVKEPGKRSRLWAPEEVCDVLNSNRGSHLVEGIMLDMSKSRDLYLSADSFSKMINLRFLKFYNSGKTSCEVYSPSALESISNKLRYFSWDAYPLKSLPTKFCAEKLVEFSMPKSNVEKLWDGTQNLVNLRKIDLTYSKQLMELPDFSKATKLERVRLYACRSLCQVHPSLLHLHSLISLSVYNCVQLKSLRSETHLRSLRDLVVEGCSNLKDFSLSSDKVEELLLWDTAIEILPSSIGRFGNLRKLTLRESLRSLPNELSNLTSLWQLDIVDCKELETWNLHIILDGLTGLRDLSLKGSNLESLPTSIRNLSCLEYVDISNCSRLQWLPELPPSLELLEANNCTSLETLITSTPLKCRLSAMYFLNCMKLDLQCIEEFVLSKMKQGSSIEICFPGSRVPQWVTYGNTQNPVAIELAPRSDFLGLAVCLVLSRESTALNERIFNIKGQCLFEDGESYRFKRFIFNNFVKDWISDHVYLWYDPSLSRYILEAIKNSRGRAKNDQQGTTHNPKLSFGFHATYCFGDVEFDGVIQECGMLPLYASEHENSISQMEVDLESRSGNKKRFRDMDDHQLLQRKKFNECEYVDEFLGASTSGIGVGCSEFDQFNHYEIQPPTQIEILNKFIFQPCLTNISTQNALLDSTQMNSICLLDQFSEYKNTMMQFGPAGVCPDFNGMARDGNSLGGDQQSPSLSLWLNERVAQMNPADIMPNSGEYVSSSSSGLPEIVQMAQANAFGSTSLSNFGMPSFKYQNFINQMGSKTNRGQYELEADEQLQLPPTKKIKESALQPDVPLGFALELNTKYKRDFENEGIEVGGSSHKNQNEQESFLTHKGMEGIYLPTPSN